MEGNGENWLVLCLFCLFCGSLVASLIMWSCCIIGSWADERMAKWHE